MTTLLAWLWMLFVVAPLLLLLLLLYTVGIQYEAGGVCWVLLPLVLVA